MPCCYPVDNGLENNEEGRAPIPPSMTCNEALLRRIFGCPPKEAPPDPNAHFVTITIEREEVCCLIPVWDCLKDVAVGLGRSIRKMYHFCMRRDVQERDINMVTVSENGSSLALEDLFHIQDGDEGISAGGNANNGGISAGENANNEGTNTGDNANNEETNAEDNANPVPSDPPLSNAGDATSETQPSGQPSSNQTCSHGTNPDGRGSGPQNCQQCIQEEADRITPAPPPKEEDHDPDSPTLGSLAEQTSPEENNQVTHTNTNSNSEPSNTDSAN